MINIALVKNTVEKEVRNKAVVFLFFFTLLFMYLGNQLASYVKTFVEESNATAFISDQTQTIIILAIGISAKLVSILIASNIIKSDLESGVISQLLTLPIKRSTYVISRIVGGVSLSAIYLILIMSFGLIVLSVNDVLNLNPLNFFLSLLFQIIQILVIMFISCFFSLYSNKLVTFVLTILYVTISSGVFSYAIKGYELFNGLNFASLNNLIFYYLLPRVGEISHFADTAFAGNMDDASKVLMGLGHLVVTVGAWGMIFNYLFKKRSF